MSLIVMIFFFFNDTATTEIYTLSLHDALPISSRAAPDPAPYRLENPAPLLRLGCANRGLHVCVPSAWTGNGGRESLCGRGALIVRRPALSSGARDPHHHFRRGRGRRGSEGVYWSPCRTSSPSA